MLEVLKSVGTVPVSGMFGIYGQVLVLWCQLLLSLRSRGEIESGPASLCILSS